MFDSNTLNPHRSDKFLLITLRGFSALAGITTVLILLFLIAESFPVFQKFGLLVFFIDSSWYPREQLFNLVPMMTASLLAATCAVLLAAPLGIFSGVFCNYYAPPKLAWIYRRLIELIAGVPSVVYGFWGLVVLVPLILNIRPPGASLLAGILVLALMIFPTMALASDSIFHSFPKEQLNGASALGFSRWRTIFSLILPSVKRNLLAALSLQIGRALGETMAVLMVCGNVVQLPKSFFDPVRTLTANMALEMSYATGSHRSALFVSGLILVLLIIFLVLSAEFLQRRIQND